jgi:hypothetical protein
MAQPARMARSTADDDTAEIDMERVVTDPEYRRRIITRLRRVRQMTRTSLEGDDSADFASGDED